MQNSALRKRWSARIAAATVIAATVALVPAAGVQHEGERLLVTVTQPLDQDLVRRQFACARHASVSLPAVNWAVSLGQPGERHARRNPRGCWA
ncbi:hypothetical protein [Streptomyces sp. NPDC047706]|uniref:hypothetical protein n=1 Tax=Streptomyces sp. NPDC047706 TaxID=3365486 RepID=UPI00370F8FDD